MVSKTVFPNYCASFFIQRTIIKEVRESRPDVGSSSIMTCGSLMSSKAIEVLFFSPPEIPLSRIPPTITSRHFSSFNSLHMSSMRLAWAQGDSFSFKFAANYRVSRTVRVCISTSCCITQLPKSPKSQKEYLLLLAQTSPDRFQEGTLQARTLRRVVFPAPEGPIMAVTSPAGTIPDTSLSIIVEIYSLWHGRTNPICFCVQTVQVRFWKAMSIKGFMLAASGSQTMARLVLLSAV